MGLLCIALLGFLPATDAYALPAAWKHSLERELWRIVKAQPKYTWGGFKNEREGFDCSGMLFRAAVRAGIPGVTRQTARNMARGIGGWSGQPIKLRDADETDLLWWTWKDRPDRIWGHVGTVLLGIRSRLLEVVHASGSKKRVVMQPMRGVLLRDLKLIRRLTIGDERK